MVHTHDTRGSAEILPPLAIALLSPLIVVVSAAILFALLGIFIAWLTVVGVLIAAVVASDLAHRAMRRWERPPGLDRQAIGYLGR